MVSSVLNCAVEQRLIPSNPTKGCVLPKLERKEMKILPSESLGAFFEEAPLKTKNSYRNIAIGADAVKVLKSMEQKNEYVFPSPYGGPMFPDSVLHMLQRVLKRAGLERIRFHDLCHTFSELALQNGVDVKTLSAMLGHYSAGFTLDTYAHVTTSMQKQAANAVGSFLSGALR
ncbi:tyrosine-type recombinase/integrase [Oscillibacter sp.]|uniref:tyrosine-type recombinase/integrase n=1 Tax=Oscillibacter sp. TaxID=1945593 RepID=UPI002D8054E1|nr:site-specific integrase [Oscillibacter sp.]